MKGHPRGAAVAFALLACLAACKQRATTAEDDGSHAPAAPVTAAATPKDHVSADTLVPGKEKAYALVLPMGFQIESRVDKVIATYGPAAPKQVVNYLKERVRDGKVTEDERRTMFRGVRLGDEPDRYLDIDVTDKRAMTLVTVTDVTPPPAPPPASQDERFKQVGLDPRGHILDPKRSE